MTRVFALGDLIPGHTSGQGTTHSFLWVKPAALKIRPLLHGYGLWNGHSDAWLQSPPTPVILVTPPHTTRETSLNNLFQPAGVTLGGEDLPFDCNTLLITDYFAHLSLPCVFIFYMLHTKSYSRNITQVANSSYR